MILMAEPEDVLLNRQLADPFIKDKIQALTSKDTPKEEYKALERDYCLSASGLLFRMIYGKRDSGHTAFVLPESMIYDALEDAHESMAYGGHLGYHKTLSKIKEKFWFPKMNSTILRFILTCDFCSRNKA